jgi:GntR family transcriptional repressor for pyruvate dehydrogenase complex
MKTPMPTVPPPASPDAPHARRLKLSERISLSLRQEYLSGQLSGGQKLPTELQLSEVFGVSRTVIREAVAGLAADGLLESRQGAGIFVVEQPAGATMPPVVRQDLPNNISNALNVLEVRIALEMESAALAAVRKNSSQEARIQETFFEFDRLLQIGHPTGKADFDFHRSIAEATNNPFYVEVLDGLGTRTIPCDVTSPHATEEVLSFDYQAGLQKEHLAIMNAILLGDADQARVAMREHLAASQQRYRSRMRERVNLYTEKSKLPIFTTKPD